MPNTTNSFDEAAADARQKLKDLDPAAVEAVAKWWAANYMSAGHKRLGRTLVAIANGKDDILKEG